MPASDALAWVRSHEREFEPGARLLVLGDIPMPAAQPQFRQPVELRTRPLPAAPRETRVTVVGERGMAWRRMFAALDGPLRVAVEAAPNAKTELIVWDTAATPPAGLRAPLWWVTNEAAFPELAGSASVDGIRYADSARGRVWTSSAWPPANPAAARRLLETWQGLHAAPVPYTAPASSFAPSIGSAIPSAIPHADGALRDMLMMALVALFALERIVTHARRR
jgi:hypothetical protein